ncbi:fumarylacetoacetate hydrolase family protein [Sciscionella sediminilitoris]|uniref:fumarylacetoacetate hydrolase family protein n=1 Tax=Sciscionella sediminilitoris TaxID=1445613 RepID=UPI0004DF1704|nr:fumarylacetoacetate hydrolase family protein [Sciscionella sp. SE31]
MRLLNVAGRAVLETAEGRVDVATASSGRFGPGPQDLFEVWDAFRSWVRTARPVPVGAIDGPLAAPVPRPPQVFAVGLNYGSHAEETGLAVATDRPLVFTKFSSSIAGPEGDLVLSGDQVDWEVELVIVIGRPARRVAPEQAWEHVAGCTVGQDFSDRAVQMQGSPPQFSLGKSFPGYGPLGPALVTPEQFADRDDLALRCQVNGETVQEGRTSLMIHPVARLVSLLSWICPLGPGDVVFTGTPDGVGMGRKPPRYLKPGDTVVTTIEGIGTMIHRCVAGSEVHQ